MLNIRDLKLSESIPLTDDLDDYPPESPLMTVDEWLSCVHNGLFIDYDGYGCWATANDVSKEIVVPSDITVKGLKPPAWATHIEWYNK